MKDFAEKFFGLVEAANNVVITSHISPDEDSISSVLAVYEIIQQKYPGKKVRVIYSNEPVARFSSFKNFDKIEFVADVASELAGVDLLICLDGGQYYRFSQEPEKLQAVKNKICLDHHSSPPDQFDLSLIDPNISSCSELIYRVFEGHFALNKELAEVFLLGILGDTGVFAFVKPSQSETFLIAKGLVEAGQISISEFLSRYRNISQREFAVIQEFIKNTQFGAGFQYSFVDREFAKNFTEAELTAGKDIYVGNFLRQVDGASWGFTIVPVSDGTCKISVRSNLGSINARELMEKMGIGGGHDRAAGGTFKISDPAECVKQVISFLSSPQFSANE